MLQLTTIGTRAVAILPPDATALEAAVLMKERSVGSVVVLKDRRPLGIVTDRDLALRVLLERRDPGRVLVQDVMSRPLAMVTEDEDPLTAATLMRARQVRRLPVIRPDGTLAGILCLDDLIHHLARTHHELSETVAQFPVPFTAG